MNRFQITADVDVTLWLGVLTKYKRQSNKIEYINLEELFESENVYFPTRDELNMNIQIKGIKSDNLMAKIEQVVAAAIEHSANEECNVKYEVLF